MDLADATGRSLYWSGTWKVDDSGCDTSRCCCPKSGERFDLSLDGSTVSATSLAVEGVCGGDETADVSNLLRTTQTGEGTLTFDSAPQYAMLSADTGTGGLILVADRLSQSSCSFQASCVDGRCIVGGGPLNVLSIILIAALAATVLCLASLGALYFCGCLNSRHSGAMPKPNSNTEQRGATAGAYNQPAGVS
jgi:hypothetical protein